MTDRLKTLLAEVGLDPDDYGDPGEAWRRLHERLGRRITLVDRYELEGRELDREERARISREVLAVQYPGAEFAGTPRGDPVDVVPYDPVWPRRFEEWRAPPRGRARRHRVADRARRLHRRCRASPRSR